MYATLRLLSVRGRLHPHKNQIRLGRRHRGACRLLPSQYAHAPINTGVGVFADLSIRNSIRNSHLQNR
jgi:hypothetical protein